MLVANMCINLTCQEHLAAFGHGEPIAMGFWFNSGRPWRLQHRVERVPRLRRGTANFANGETTNCLVAALRVHSVEVDRSSLEVCRRSPHPMIGWTILRWRLGFAVCCSFVWKELGRGARSLPFCNLPCSTKQLSGSHLHQLLLRPYYDEDLHCSRCFGPDRGHHDELGHGHEGVPGGAPERQLVRAGFGPPG
jgi:hypothetical protein